LCRPDRAIGHWDRSTHTFFPLLEMSIRNNDFSNGSLVVCWFSFGGFFLGVFYSFTFFFPPFLFLLLFGDPLRTRVVMTFLLTHLHSPHFVLDSFLLFSEKKTKRNQAKNGFKLPKLQCRLWGYVRASTLKLLSGPS
jgi:hypothetical protein